MQTSHAAFPSAGDFWSTGTSTIALLLFYLQTTELWWLVMITSWPLAMSLQYRMQQHMSVSLLLLDTAQPAKWQCFMLVGSNRPYFYNYLPFVFSETIADVRNGSFY